MVYPSFEDDRKWCPRCDRYVQYIQSIYLSYCIECGSKVELFDPEQSKALEDRLQRSAPRPKT